MFYLCMYVCVPHAYIAHNIRYPRTGVMGGYEPSCGFYFIKIPKMSEQVEYMEGPQKYPEDERSLVIISWILIL